MKSIIFALLLGLVAMIQTAEAAHPWGSTVFCTDEDDTLLVIEAFLNDNTAEVRRLIVEDPDVVCYAIDPGVGPMYGGEVYFASKGDLDVTIVQSTFRGLDVWAFLTADELPRVLHLPEES